MGLPSTTSGKLQDVFVLNTTKLSAEATLADFIANSTDGDVGFYDSTGALFSVGGANLIGAGESYTIVQNRKGEIYQKPYVNGADNADLDYRPSVKQVDTVTITGAATAVGQTFTVRVVRAGLLAQPYPKEVYKFVSVTGSETNAQIAAAIVADFTDKLNFFQQKGHGVEPRVTLVDAGGGVITVTAVDDEPIDTLTGDDLFTIATVATTTLPEFEYGSTEDALQLELEGSIFEGVRERNANRQDNWGEVNPYVKEGSTYDRVTLESTETEREIGDHFEEHVYTACVTILIETDAVGATGGANYTEVKGIFQL